MPLNPEKLAAAKQRATVATAAPVAAPVSGVDPEKLNAAKRRRRLAEVEGTGAMPGLLGMSGDSMGGAIGASEYRNEYTPYSDAPADMSVAAGAATIEDEDTRIEHFAKSRYPDMDSTERRKRYGTHEGDVVYVDDDGALQYEVAGKSTLSYVGIKDGLPVAGGVVGAAVGGPVTAGLGAGLGMSVRKLVGQMFFDDKQTAKGNALDIGVEVAVNAGGALAGKGIAAYKNRGVADDLESLDLASAKGIIDLGKQHGVEVTPAEATALRSEINRQTHLGMGLDEAADILAKFYDKRARQENFAIEDFIGAATDANTAGAALRNNANTAIASAKGVRAGEAKPLYDEAFYTPDGGYQTLPPGVYEQIASNDMYRKGIDALKSDPDYGLTDVPENSVYFLDKLKRYYDAKGKPEVSNSIDAFKRGNMQDAAKEVREVASSTVPKYADARAKFADKSPPVDELENGLTGVLSKVQDKNLATAADKVLSSKNSTPEAVGKIRQQFTDAGNSGEWDNVLNVWLRQQWDTAGDVSTDWSRGVNWRARVYGKINSKSGDTRKRGMMRAAMGPRRFEAFENLMQVLEATNRVPKSQSITSSAQEATKRQAYDAAPILTASKGFGVTGLRDWWQNSRVDSWRADIAQVITNEESLSTLGQLKKLKSLNPSNERVLQVVSNALTQSGVMGARGVLSQPSNQVPQALRRPPQQTQ